MAQPGFEIIYGNPIIENAKNIENALRVKIKENNEYYFEDVFGDIEDAITIKIKQGDTVLDATPTYNVKNEQDVVLGKLSKETTKNAVEIPNPEENYIISVELNQQDGFLPFNLYFKILPEVTVKLKPDYFHSIDVNSPMSLGFVDNYKTKNSFKESYLTVDKDDAELKFNIYKNGLSLEDVDGFGIYKIEIDCDNYILSDDSDKIFYGKVDKYKTTNTIINSNKKYNFDGSQHDVSDNVKNDDGLTVEFSRKSVVEIGKYEIEFFTEETDKFYSSSGSFNVEVVRSPSLIEHSEVINIIRNSLLEIMDEDYYYYKDYNVVLAKEQEFIKLKQAKPNSIYIVIKFGSASINFSQTVLPITLTAMSEQNKLDVCQKLLSDFVNKYNLETSDDSTIRQIYELPVVTSNFNKVFEGFRSILFVNGYFVISKNANFYELESAKEDTSYHYNEEYINNFSIENDKFLIGVNNKEGTYSFTYSYGSWYVNGFETNLEEIKTKYGITFNLKVGASMLPNSEELFKIVYDNLWEPIPLLSFNFNADFQLDSQPFFNRSNFSESIAKYGVLSFNINTYMLNDIDIVNKAFQMALKQTDASINKTFKLKIKLKNGIELQDKFKLLSVNSQQNIAEIPVVSLSFTN